MEEFNSLEKVKKLFEEVNGYGEKNIIFIAYNDLQKRSGLVNGMEYPYEGLLINKNENGIGMFYLRQPVLALSQNVAKMNVNKDSYIFVPNDDIVEIKVKNYALFNSKAKRISIKTKDGKKHLLFTKATEKSIPYQDQNANEFYNMYMKR